MALLYRSFVLFSVLCVATNAQTFYTSADYSADTCSVASAKRLFIILSDTCYDNGYTSSIYNFSDISNPIVASYQTRDCTGAVSTAPARSVCSRIYGEFSFPLWERSSCFSGNITSQFVGTGLSTVYYSDKASCSGAVTRYVIAAPNACATLFDKPGYNSTYTNCGNNYKTRYECTDYSCSVGCTVVSHMPLNTTCSNDGGKEVCLNDVLTAPTVPPPINIPPAAAPLASGPTGAPKSDAEAASAPFTAFAILTVSFGLALMNIL
eukprot:TRINITY_DN15608_c0_g1_i1.p1 TRINITY_DN15608_c0_g1~~TRINITY_DN15608_c0_g1_i1.p1  ORF type:complete len:265 (+),score=16.94 TRINITY_DN15608_c0_g1_i1:20-814(+)